MLIDGTFRAWKHNVLEDVPNAPIAAVVMAGCCPGFKGGGAGRSAGDVTYALLPVPSACTLLGRAVCVLLELVFRDELGRVSLVSAAASSAVAERSFSLLLLELFPLDPRLLPWSLPASACPTEGRSSSFAVAI